MFEPSRDQAAGLRRLFGPQPMNLLPLGCSMDDASDRAGVEAMASALVRAGRRPLLVDLLGDSGVSRERSFAHIDAGALLPDGAGTRDLTRFFESLGRRTMDGAGAFDVALVAADPLRLADLTAGVVDRIVLVARTRGEGLARTYSQIKAMHLAHGFRTYCALFLDARSRAAALASHRRLADTAARFLGAAIEFGGAHDTIEEERFADDALRWSQPLEAASAA